MSEKMTAAEVGRKGGQTTKERYGSDHFSKIGRQGGAATMKRYGPKHYAEIGMKGGAKTKELIARGKEAERWDR